jgi:hypothetical protein
MSGSVFFSHRGNCIPDPPLAGLSHQGESVCRYLGLLLACCPPDRSCLAALTSFLGVDPSALPSPATTPTNPETPLTAPPR